MSFQSNPGLLWVVLLCYVIVPENSHHFLNQSDAKLKPITTWSLSFPCAFSSLIFSLLWLAVLIVLVLVFHNLIKKCSNWEWKNRCKVQENLVWYTVTWNIQMRNICFSTQNQILYRFVATLNFWLPIRVYKKIFFWTSLFHHVLPISAKFIGKQLVTL